MHLIFSGCRAGSRPTPRIETVPAAYIAAHARYYARTGEREGGTADPKVAERLLNPPSTVDAFRQLLKGSTGGAGERG